jgi:hypothetical protein
MSLRSSIFLIVAAFALTIPGSRGQENLLSPENAVAIARAVNTAEAEFLGQSKHPVDLQSLRSHGLIQPIESKIEIDWSANPNSFSAKGYDVRLVLTNDQTQYTLTVLPKPEHWKSRPCPPAFITNESGLIFQGFVLGCEATSGVL